MDPVALSIRRLRVVLGRCVYEQVFPESNRFFLLLLLSRIAVGWLLVLFVPRCIEEPTSALPVIFHLVSCPELPLALWGKELLLEPWVLCLCYPH